MAIAAVRVVGTASVKGGGHATPLVLTSASGAAAGDLVAVFCHLTNLATAATFSIVDSGSNTWRKALGEFGDGSTFGRAVIFTSKLTNPIAAGGTITVTTSEDGTLTLSAGEWSGVDDVTDQSASATGNDASPTVSTALATTNANDLVIGMVGAVAPTATTFTAGASLNTTIPIAAGTTLSVSTTAGAVSSNSNNNPEWAIVAATGTQTINGSLSVIRNWCAGVLALQATAAVAGAPVGEQWTDLSPQAFEVVRQAGNRIASRAGVMGEWNNILPSLVGKDRFFRGPGQAPNYDWPNPSFVVQTRAANQVTRLAQDSSQIHQFTHELDGKDLFRGGFGKAPNWDWPNPSFVVQSRAAYRAAQLAQDQTQVHQFFHGLDGKDALVVGQSTLDTRLPPVGRQVRTWKAQDSVDSGLALTVAPAAVTLPPGESVLDLPPAPTPARDFTFLAWYTYADSAVIQPYQSVNDLPPAAPSRRQPSLEPGVQSLALNNTSVALPPGVQSVDLPPRGPARARDYSFTATFPLELIGQDAVNPGEQSTDLPPRGPQRSRDYTWLQTFSLDVYAQEPAGASTAATELPPRAALRAREYGQASGFPLELIGQDSLTVGEQSCDLPPRAPARSRDYSFVATFPPVLIGQDAQNAGEQSTDLPPRAAARAREYGQASGFPLELIGQDQLPTGEQSVDLPVPAAPRRRPALEPGVNALALTAPPVGAQAVDLPPRGAARARDYSFVASFPLELIGQDALTVGEQRTELPPRAAPQIQSTFEPGIQALALPVPPTNLPYGAQVYDLPTPPTARRSRDYTFVQSFPLELLNKDVFFRGAGDAPNFDWPNPSFVIQSRAAYQTARLAQDSTQVHQFTLELIGKDQRNPGQSTETTALPPRGPARARDYTFTASFPLELIGKDRLNPGRQSVDLPTPARPRHQSPLEPGTDALALTVAPEALPCGEQTIDLPPAAAPRRQPALEVGAQALALTVTPTVVIPAPVSTSGGGLGYPIDLRRYLRPEPITATLRGTLALPTAHLDAVQTVSSTLRGRLRSPAAQISATACIGATFGKGTLEPPLGSIAVELTIDSTLHGAMRSIADVERIKSLEIERDDLEALFLST